VPIVEKGVEHAHGGLVQNFQWGFVLIEKIDASYVRKLPIEYGTRHGLNLGLDVLVSDV
jgi:hypothetical protein